MVASSEIMVEENRKKEMKKDKNGTEHKVDNNHQ